MNKGIEVVRIHSGDSMDRSKFIPLSKVDMIMLNDDGTDYVRSNGEDYICFEGCFRITVLKAYAFPGEFE